MVNKGLIRPCQKPPPSKILFVAVKPGLSARQRRGYDSRHRHSRRAPFCWRGASCRFRVRAPAGLNRREVHRTNA